MKCFFIFCYKAVNLNILGSDYRDTRYNMRVMSVLLDRNDRFYQCQVVKQKVLEQSFQIQILFLLIKQKENSIATKVK